MKKLNKSTKESPITRTTKCSAVMKALMLAMVLVFFGCKKDEKIVEPAQEVELEVTINVPYIIFEDDEDLMAQLREAITIENLVVPNGRLAQKSELDDLPSDVLDFIYLINEDKDLATITLDIAEKYKDDYKLAKGFVNSFAIKVRNLDSALTDWIGRTLNRLVWGADLPERNTLKSYISNNINSFDFQNAAIVCVPVNFYYLENSRFYLSQVPAIITELNSSFLGAKIQFEQSVVESFTINGSKNVILINDVGDYKKEENKLNIYIGDNLGYSKDIEDSEYGRAHFPVKGKFTTAVFIRSIFMDVEKVKSKTIKLPLLSHEIGHTFSLFHTFHNLGGDGISTTVKETDKDGVVPNNSTCDAVNYNNSNFMSYSHLQGPKDFFKDGFINRCDYTFNEEQNKRMRLAYQYWFSDKLINCNPQSSAISLSKDITFPNTQINTNSAIQVLTISNTGNVSFNVTDITSSNNAFTIINGRSTSILPNEELEIQIRFSPTQARSYTDIISVRNDADNTNSSNSSISVSGVGIEEEVEATSEITLSVSSLAFADTEVNTTSEKTFRISNTGTENFDVLSIDLPTGYSASPTSGTITAGASKSFTITFRPTSATDYNGTININHNADNGNGSSSISVRGRGTEEEVATASEITLSVSSLAFADTEVNTTSEKTFRISNTGTANFDVQSFNLPTGYSASPTSARITAGTSRNFTITFRPTSVRDYNGFITAISNANSGNGAISVSGRGVSSSSSQNVDLRYNDKLIKDGNDGGQGNSNRIIEAGEEIDLEVQLINNGNTTATNVSVTLSTSDPDIDITDDYEPWSNIPAGATEWESDFDFAVSSSISTKTVTFNLAITSDQGSWNRTFTLDVVGSSSSSNYSDINVESITFDNEGDGQYDIDVDIRNVGNTATPSGEDMTIRYYVNGTYIGDDTNDNMDPDELDREFLNNYQFTSNGNHTIRVDISQMSNEIVTSNNTKTVNLNVTGVSGGGGGSAIAIEPGHGCSTARMIQVNTEYQVTINTADYSRSSPIARESSGGNNVRGFWFSFQVPVSWGANHNVKIYDVSSNFDPVLGIRANCFGPYLGQIDGSNFNDYVNDNGLGSDETSATNLPGNVLSDNIYHVRIYHYYGSQSPTISFKIKVE